MALVLCPEIQFTQEIVPPLSQVEERLVCGDPENEPWRRIPISQGEMLLKSFLQERGYFFPVTQKLENKLVVEPGARATVRSWRLEGLEETDARKMEGERSKKRKVLGSIMTPGFLTFLEKWVTTRLQWLGYPCPVVKGEAEPARGEVVIRVESGQPQNLVRVTREPIEGAVPDILSRFDAFRLDELYDDRLMLLSSQRAVSSQIVDSTYFQTQCKPEGAVADQKVSSSPPRLLKFGFGANTEGLLLVRASWRNTRLGDMASSFEVSTFVSAREQNLMGISQWFWLPYVTRRHLSPVVELKHLNETSFETVSTGVGLAHAHSVELKTHSLAFSFGPSLNAFRVLRGVGDPSSKFLSLRARVELLSHDHEFNRADPLEGDRLDLEIDLNNESVMSSTSVQRFHLNGQKLWNLRQFDPPLFILGMRGAFGTLLTDESKSQVLPPDFRFFLGGSETLRGFGRKELPLDGVGALSAFYLGFEGRLTHTVPLGLEPLVLLDVGGLGGSGFGISNPIYWSPGFGLRLKSPVGVFRTTFARGYSTGRPEQGHFQFFLSYGQEF